MKNGLLYALIGCCLWAADRTPQQALVRLGRLVGRLTCLLGSGLRATALENVRDALAVPWSEHGALVRRCFENAGENLALCLLLRRRAVRARDWIRISPESEAALRGALSSGKGVVFVSAHMGPFEMIPAVLAEIGISPTVVVRESYDPRLDPLVDRHRKLRGVEVIHRGDPGAAMRIARALRGKKPVGFLPDLGGRVPSIKTQFLSAHSYIPVGPQRIAVRCGAPLVVGTLHRIASGTQRCGQSFELEIRRIDDRADEATLTHRVSRALSARIRAQPDQWLWMARQNGSLPRDLLRS